MIAVAATVAVGGATSNLATSALSQVMTIDVEYRPSPLIAIYGTVALLLTLVGSLPPAISAARMPIVRALAAD